MLKISDITKPMLAARFIRGIALLTMLICGILLSTPARAQVLQAKWVEESEARIEEIRKADLRIIVIDKAGNPVPRCPVQIAQKRHAFLFGLRLPKAMPDNAPTKEAMSTTPLWRVFNAAALDHVTHWPATQPAADKWDFENVEKQLAWATDRKLLARWGGIISSDPGRMPDWAAGLRGDDLRQAIEAHTEKVISKFGRHFEQFDVVTQLIDHKHLEKELGFAAIRRLYTLAESQRPAGAASPFGRSTVAFEDGFAPDRLRKALTQATAMREGFVPIDSLAIEVRLNGSLVEAPITRNLSFMGDPGLPVVVTNLEVAGSSRAAAAVNLETALRAMFAHASVKGIFFAGLRSEELHSEDAALINDEGGLTESGELLDRMVRELWWSNVTALADDLGNVKQRVFAGQYQLTATLPDGTIADAQVMISAGEQRLILLQPVKAAPRLQPQLVGDPVQQAAPAGERDEAVITTAKDPITAPSETSKPRPVDGRSRLEFDAAP